MFFLSFFLFVYYWIFPKTVDLGMMDEMKMKRWISNYLAKDTQYVRESKDCVSGLDSSPEVAVVLQASDHMLLPAWNLFLWLSFSLSPELLQPV